MSAPHLPPPSCSVPLRRRLERVPMIILFTVLALLASLCVSLLVVSRFAFSPVSETRIVVAGSTTKENTTLDPSVLRDAKEKTVTLIDVAKKSYDGYPKSAFLGQAALLSTEGWAVTTAVLPTTLSSIRALDAQGVLHTLSEQKIDTTSGLRYIKMNSSGFRIFDVSLDVPQVAQAMPVFSFDHLGASPVLLSQVDPVTRPSFVFALSTLSLITDPVLDTSSILITDRGMLAGLTTKEGAIIPGFVVHYGLPLILAGKTITPRTLPYTFTTINGVSRGDQFIQTDGFVITRILPKGSKEVLRVGDIVTRIDNTQAAESSLYALLFDTRDSTTFTVLRDGVETDVVVPLK